MGALDFEWAIENDDVVDHIDDSRVTLSNPDFERGMAGARADK